MRLFILVAFFILNSTVQFAQQEIIEVKGAYYVVSSQGELMVKDAFRDVRKDLPHRGQLLVNRNGLFGVIENNAYVIQPEYASITNLFDDSYHKKGYVLEKNNLYGVVDQYGSIAFPVSYTSVRYKMDQLSNSKHILILKKGDETTIVFQKKNLDFQTIYTGQLDDISVFNGLIRIQKGEKSALWTYEDSEDQMLPALPFSNVKVSRDYNEFHVYDPVKKTVRTYSYSNRFLREQRNVTAYEEYTQSFDSEGGDFDVAMAVIPEPNILSLDRHDALTNKNSRIKRFITEEEFLMNYKWLTRLSEKKVKVERVEVSNGTLEIYYLGKLNNNSIRDTMVSIPAAELLTWNSNQSACLVKNKDQMAIYSIDGIELYPFTKNAISFVPTEHGIDWYVVKDKKQSSILFYNVKANKLETVLQVPAGTECEFMDQVIQLSSTKGKTKTVRFVVAAPSHSLTGPCLKLTERSEVFESVVPMKNYPGLLLGKSHGKFGVLDITGKVLLPCSFDSIQCEAYYDFEYLKKGISVLKPIVKAYVKDSFQLHVAQGNPTFWRFEASSGYFSAGTIVTDDALAVYEPQAANQYLVYTIDGQLLSKVPLIISKPQLSLVSYNDAFWYVFGLDINHKTIVLLSNEKRIELP